MAPSTALEQVEMEADWIDAQQAKRGAHDPAALIELPPNRHFTLDAHRSVPATAPSPRRTFSATGGFGPTRSAATSSPSVMRSIDASVRSATARTTIARGMPKRMRPGLRSMASKSAADCSSRSRVVSSSMSGGIRPSSRLSSGSRRALQPSGSRTDQPARITRPSRGSTRSVRGASVRAALPRSRFPVRAPQPRLPPRGSTQPAGSARSPGIRRASPASSRGTARPSRSGRRGG